MGFVSVCWLWQTFLARLVASQGCQSGDTDTYAHALHVFEKLDFVTRLGQAVWHLRSFSSARPEAVALGSAARPERSGVSRDSVRTKDGNAHARFQRADEH